MCVHVHVCVGVCVGVCVDMVMREDFTNQVTHEQRLGGSEVSRKDIQGNTL